jgi:hypothetical protein
MARDQVWAYILKELEPLFVIQEQGREHARSFLGTNHGLDLILEVNFHGITADVYDLGSGVAVDKLMLLDGRHGRRRDG